MSAIAEIMERVQADGGVLIRTVRDGSPDGPDTPIADLILTMRAIAFVTPDTERAHGWPIKSVRADGDEWRVDLIGVDFDLAISPFWLPDQRSSLDDWLARPRAIRVGEMESLHRELSR